MVPHPVEVSRELDTLIENKLGCPAEAEAGCCPPGPPGFALDVEQRELLKYLWLTGDSGPYVGSWSSEEAAAALSSRVIPEPESRRRASEDQLPTSRLRGSENPVGSQLTLDGLPFLPLAVPVCGQASGSLSSECQS